MGERRHYIVADGEVLDWPETPTAADAYAYAGPRPLGFPSDPKEPKAPTVVLVLRAGIAGELADYLRRWDAAWEELGIHSEQRLYDAPRLAEVLEMAHITATGEKPYHLLTAEEIDARREAALPRG